ncbi:GrpB family protein [Streptomyces flavofungini]|uniref:GrpB family protein n=1 Tax=Streptomyces flavofungini TaxID=68200 RepID=UPI0025B01AA2|nr:GrpB family protein [Streptomyces flavofungini]WJV50778.1 GrpB family protein [Streptomyces flavofungini]
MGAEEIHAANVGTAPKLNGRVTLVDHDPRWPLVFAAEAARVGGALTDLRHTIEHVGSTSVPGLPAKPVIDMLLTVPDPGEEATYVPVLEQLGYTLAIREPDWYQHRVLRRYDLAPGAASANLHVFPAGCEETARMLRFRDWLRAHDDDRDLYARTKRALAERTWEYLQNYADAKTGVVEEILARAAGAGEEAVDPPGADEPGARDAEGPGAER